MQGSGSNLGCYQWQAAATARPFVDSGNECGSGSNCASSRMSATRVASRRSTFLHCYRYAKTSAALSYRRSLPPMARKMKKVGEVSPVNFQVMSNYFRSLRVFRRVTRCHLRHPDPAPATADPELVSLRDSFACRRMRVSGSWFDRLTMSKHRHAFHPGPCNTRSKSRSLRLQASCLTRPWKLFLSFCNLGGMVARQYGLRLPSPSQYSW